MNHQKKTTFLVALFTIIVLVWSYLFFQVRPITFDSLSWPYEWKLTIAWLPALGVFLAGLIFRGITEAKEKISLTGGSFWSVAVILVPIILLTIWGLPNEQGINAHYFGAVVGLIVVVYTLFEEYGWRGFLHPILNPKQLWIKYVIIGLIWYAWHWDFLDKPALLSNLIFAGGLILGSWGIGQLADSRKSILVCAAAHSLGNIGFLYPLVTDPLSFQSRMIILGLSIVLWIVIFKFWPLTSTE